ncbi:hypothetical protein [Acinetobacter puyangensis]|uniref:hypothetical protein n=1 Tax=Acinetobacter puyangensis TaxID=1096779 RepID=UPI003A4DB9B4
MNQKHIQSQTSERLYHDTPSHRLTFWDKAKQAAFTVAEAFIFLLAAMVLLALANTVMGGL